MAMKQEAGMRHATARMLCWWGQSEPDRIEYAYFIPGCSGGRNEGGGMSQTDNTSNNTSDTNNGNHNLTQSAESTALRLISDVPNSANSGLASGALGVLLSQSNSSTDQASCATTQILHKLHPFANQTDWVCKPPDIAIRVNSMKSENTRYSLFQLNFGHNSVPRIIIWTSAFSTEYLLSVCEF